MDTQTEPTVHLVGKWEDVEFRFLAFDDRHYAYGSTADEARARFLSLKVDAS